MLKTPAFHKMATILALLFVIFAVVALAIAGDYAIAVVNNPNPSDRLNLRASPRKDSESLGRYYTGVLVEVTRQIDTAWLEVSVYGRKGYMEAKYLTICGLQSGLDQSIIDRIGSAKPKAAVGGQRPQDGLHLRDRPSDKGNSYGKFYNGTAIEILGVIEDGAWYHVYLPDTQQYGFMLGKYVQISGGDAGGAQTTGTGGVYAIVNNPNASDRLNLRIRASATATSLGKYFNGTTVEILSDNGTWCQVKVDGKTGYMQNAYLLKDSALKPLLSFDIGRLAVDGA